MSSFSEWNEYPATTTPTGTNVELFPVMQDGNQPITGYVITGDCSNHWGSHAANMAVKGKYMITGAQWFGKDNSTKASKIAKVFTAPKDGTIKITAAGAAGSTTEGYIITNYFSDSKVTHSSGSGTADISTLSWSVEINGETKWQKTFSDITTQKDYPSYFTGVAFGEIELDVTEGQKIYFSLNPVGWTSARDLMACMWDPFVSYADENGIYEKSNVLFDKVDLTQDSFKSSNYLNPEKQYVDNPWTVEADIKVDGDWKSVESFVVRKDSKALFPTMADGVTPQGGYIANGDINSGWSTQGLNLVVNGKYMIPGSIYVGSDGDGVKAAKSGIAKVFTAPKAKERLLLNQ